MSISSRMDKQITVPSPNAILSKNKNEQIRALLNNKHKSKKHHVEQKQLDTKEYTLYDSTSEKFKNR